MSLPWNKDKKETNSKEVRYQLSAETVEDHLKSLEDEVRALSQELTTLQKQLNRVERKVYRSTAEDTEEMNSTSSPANLPGMTQGEFGWLQRGWNGK